MSVQFITNVDMCKRFMGQISGLPLDRINPAVGDLVRVYHDTEFTLYMPVIERRWIMDNGTNPRLWCYLGCPLGLTIPGIEEVLRNRGFK